MSSTPPTNIVDSIMNLEEDFVSRMVFMFIVFILFITIIYILNTKSLRSKECSYMNNLYPSINGYIQPINKTNPNHKFDFYDYYIKTAYNACSGGSYKNDFVDVCNLKSVISDGVRCLDFEIYSVDNKPVVSTSTSNNLYVKETYNSVAFSSVMNVIQNYAFSSSTAPNYSDPLIIHLRFKSNNPLMYKNMVDIFKEYTNSMLGKQFSFMSNDRNLGDAPLLILMNKIVLIVDASNSTFLDTPGLLEYVNALSNSSYIRLHRYFDVKNAQDINELKNFNKTGMTVVLPDNSMNPPNPSGPLCREIGCQMVAMRYQKVDNFLKENNLFFNEAGSAFSLKPEALRYIKTTVNVKKANPTNSFAPRTTTYGFVGGNTFTFTDSTAKSRASTAKSIAPATATSTSTTTPATASATASAIMVNLKPTAAPGYINGVDCGKQGCWAGSDIDKLSANFKQQLVTNGIFTSVKDVDVFRNPQQSDTFTIMFKSDMGVEPTVKDFMLKKNEVRSIMMPSDGKLEEYFP